MFLCVSYLMSMSLSFFSKGKLPMTGMTITKLEDSENHKNAFEISGIAHYIFIYHLFWDTVFQTSNVHSEQRKKLFPCEGDQHWHRVPGEMAILAGTGKLSDHDPK